MKAGGAKEIFRELVWRCFYICIEVNGRLHNKFGARITLSFINNVVSTVPFCQLAVINAFGSVSANT